MQIKSFKEKQKQLVLSIMRSVRQKLRTKHYLNKF